MGCAHAFWVCIVGYRMLQGIIKEYNNKLSASENLVLTSGH